MNERVFIVEVEGLSQDIPDLEVRAALASTMSRLSRRSHRRFGSKQPSVRISGGSTKIPTRERVAEIKGYGDDQPRYEMNDVG